MELDRSRSCSCFLGLPRELRDMVYAAIVTIPGGLVSHAQSAEACAENYEFEDGQQRRWQDYVLLQSIMLVSRQVRKEARKVALSQNTFAFGSPKAMWTFLALLDFESRSHLSYVKLVWEMCFLGNLDLGKVATRLQQDFYLVDADLQASWHRLSHLTLKRAALEYADGYLIGLKGGKAPWPPHPGTGDAFDDWYTLTLEWLPQDNAPRHNISHLVIPEDTLMALIHSYMR